MKFEFVVVVIVLLLICLAILFRPRRHHLLSMDYYVIHLDRAKNRMSNIHTQQKKLGQKLKIVKAIDAETIPDEFTEVETQHNISIPTLWGSKAELACYLSHLTLLKQKHTTKYVLVFEDDFDVSVSNFDSNVNSLLVDLEQANEQFDILYLGNLTDYQGEPVPKNKLCTRVSKSEMACWGAHAYVVRTESLEKLTRHLSTITESYDGKLQTLAYEGQIKSLALKTNWVTQFGDDQSYIRAVPFHLMNRA
jgi:GR25 family glycosyltransferase involved in LPS biosynthesis